MSCCSEFRTPHFLYFDLGNVLLFFDHRRACRQMADVSLIPPERVWQVVFEGGLGLRYDTGDITSRQFYAEFCQATESSPKYEDLALAAADIFEVNVPMKAVLGQLEAAGWRMGLLSNTCEFHWDFVTTGRFGLIPGAFEVVALSFRLGAVKPDPAIFERAADLAGVAPRDIFYTDDIPGHVAAAREAGFDAVQYTDTPALVGDLRRRGVKFNY